MPTKLNPIEIEVLLNKCKEGERVICIAVPTRAFRIVALKEDKHFRLEQLSRQRGDKWVPLSLHHEHFAWRAYDEALAALVSANQQFMQKLREVKVQQRQMYRAQQAGALDVYTK
jgi:hypothetical protein